MVARTSASGVFFNFLAHETILFYFWVTFFSFHSSFGYLVFLVVPLIMILEIIILFHIAIFDLYLLQFLSGGWLFNLLAVFIPLYLGSCSLVRTFTFISILKITSSHRLTEKSVSLIKVWFCFTLSFDKSSTRESVPWRNIKEFFF